MQDKWNEYWLQLEKCDTELNAFLDNGCLSTIAAGKAKAFLAAWNKQKKLAADFDKYITPVEAIEVELPFKSTQFADMWKRWKDYLSEQHGQIMRSRSELSAVEHLNKISKSDDARAIEYLRYAMANRYRNFFAIDEKDASMPPLPEKTGKTSDWN